MNYFTFLIFIFITLASCSKDTDNCQTCTKTVGGVAGNSTQEVREICDNSEAEKLERSSSGTTTWTCN